MSNVISNVKPYLVTGKVLKTIKLYNWLNNGTDKFLKSVKKGQVYVPHNRKMAIVATLQ